MTYEVSEEVNKRAFEEITNAIETLKMQNFKSTDNQEVFENVHKIGILEVAQRAIQKQIPIKPIVVDVFRGYKVYGCPFCSRQIVNEDNKRCSNCGQALKWGEM